MFRNTAIALVLCGSAAVAVPANASVVYDWVCDSPTCEGDTGFGFSIEFSDAAVAAGSFVGVDGNVLGITFASSVGDGYTNELGDLVQIGGDDNDRTDFQVVFSADRSFVQSLLDEGSGNVLFFRSAFATTTITEGANDDYFVSRRRDLDPADVLSTVEIQGTLVRRPSAVPEPGPMALVAMALVVAGLKRRRRSL